MSSTDISVNVFLTVMAIGLAVAVRVRLFIDRDMVHSFELMAKKSHIFDSRFYQNAPRNAPIIPYFLFDDIVHSLDLQHDLRRCNKLLDEKRQSEDGKAHY